MLQAILIRKEEGGGRLTGEDFRRAGFSVSSAVRAGSAEEAPSSKSEKDTKRTGNISQNPEN